MSFGVLQVIVLIGWMLSGIASAGEDSRSDKRDVERGKGAAKMLFGGLLFGFGVIFFSVLVCAIVAG